MILVSFFSQGRNTDMGHFEWGRIPCLLKVPKFPVLACIKQQLNRKDKLFRKQKSIFSTRNFRGREKKL